MSRKKEEVRHGTEYSDKAIEELKKLSPLALPEYIAQCEFYDEKESRKIFDEVVAEFEKDGGTVDSILKPVMYSVADGLLEAIPGGAAMRRKGLTPQRIITECEAFSYSESDVGPCAIPVVAYVDFKNAHGVREGEVTTDIPRYSSVVKETLASTWKKRDLHELTKLDRLLEGGYAQREDRQFVRSEIENANAMAKYKESAVNKNVGTKNLQDEYTGEKNITAHRSDADLRRNDPTHRYQAQPDHIVPLSRLNDQFAGNYALSKNDIRIIANQDGNFALTSALINQKKLGKTNQEFVKDKELMAELGLSKAQQRHMVRMADEAQAKINAKANEIVAKNLTFRGIVKQADKKQAIADFVSRNGRSPTSAEKVQIEKRLARKKTNSIYKTDAEHAAAVAKDQAIGNVVLYLLKPLYWELKDSFRNGFKDGVHADSGVAAVKIRFGRIKNYLVKHAKEFLGGSVWEFIKGFVSALIEGIIGLFVGMFRSVLKLLKEGIRIFVQAAKILWGKDAAKRTPAEKGDAIVKLIGASVASLAGIGIDALLTSIGTPKILRIPLATMLSGIASALFMYLLDKADLFSVKAERRYARIKEVFDARIADMKQDAIKFDAAITERMRNDMLEFAYLKQAADKASDNHDAKQLDSVLTQMASFFAVKLPYSDAQSFVKFVKGNSRIHIDGKTVEAA